MQIRARVRDGHFTPLKFNPLSAQELQAVARLPGAVIFDGAVMLARQYVVRLINAGTYDWRTRHVASELADRLEQINFLAKSLRHMTAEYSRNVFADQPKYGDDVDQIRFMSFLYASSFYYLAFRTETILRGKKSPPLPGVTGYIPVRAITIIRNSLLEHQFDDHKDIGGVDRLFNSHYGPAISPEGPTVGDHTVRKQLNQESVLVHAEALRVRVESVLVAGLAALDHS
jgi:hypothetical protein